MRVDEVIGARGHASRPDDSVASAQLRSHAALIHVNPDYRKLRETYAYRRF